MHLAEGKLKRANPEPVNSCPITLLAVIQWYLCHNKFMSLLTKKLNLLYASACCIRVHYLFLFSARKREHYNKCRWKPIISCVFILVVINCYKAVGFP